MRLWGDQRSMEENITNAEKRHFHKRKTKSWKALHTNTSKRQSCVSFEVDSVVFLPW